ncbi:hypothetical protein [Pelosinus propionicus]|uniref:Uncharacterized protein n=1 Tax=Pelosinus propionicus DSM 13327 TaxID=1123291 RepID=A0A1I4P9M2_9FIRM|nr:hypothetical protein [Pelosinus propionicus]SFM24409.1 hypothetical protein SAMN04490355_10605 [Pelosinus propionicus DSM 13327]
MLKLVPNTSEEGKRLTEIGEEIWDIVVKSKGNKKIERMNALHEELAFIMANTLSMVKDEYQKDNDAHSQLLDQLYYFLESKDQLEEFDEYVESVINMKPTVLN